MAALKCYNCGRGFEGAGVQTEKVLCQSCGQRWCFVNGRLSWKSGVPKDAAGYVSTLHHVVAEVTNRLDAAGVFADTRAEETRQRQTDSTGSGKLAALCRAEASLAELRKVLVVEGEFGPFMKQVPDGYEYTDVRGNRWHLRVTQDERMPFTIHNIWRR